MTFADVQAYLGSLLALDVIIGPLGSPILVDPFKDPEDAKSAIGAQLRATGVCIEVGYPWLAAPETSLGGSTHGEASCEVFVAEHPKISHTPNRLQLWERVVTTCTQRPAAYQKPARLRSSDP